MIFLFQSQGAGGFAAGTAKGRVGMGTGKSILEENPPEKHPPRRIIERKVQDPEKIEIPKEFFFCLQP